MTSSRLQVKTQKFMLALERHRKILDLIQRSGAVRTADVAATLQVTEETIRRDFERLDKEAQLLRTHGGAVQIDANRRDLPLSSRETEQVREKEAIAQLATEQLIPGETIFLDASSTVFQLAKLIRDIELHVITCALKVAVELASKPGLKVTLLGGALNPGSFSTEGNPGLKELGYFRIQKAFLSCRGVDPQRGMSEANEQQASLKREVTSVADALFLLTDHTKLGLRSSFFFSPLTEIDMLITDRLPAGDFLAAIGDTNLEINTPI